MAPKGWKIEETGSLAAELYHDAIKSGKDRPVTYVENVLSLMLDGLGVVVKDGKIYVFSSEGNWCADL